MLSSPCSPWHAIAPIYRAVTARFIPNTQRSARRWALPLLASVSLCVLQSGCTVIAVAGTAVSITAGAVGLAADAAIGTAKIVGKGVGKAADALMDDDDAADNSGVNVRYRESAPQPTNTTVPAIAAEPVATPITPPTALPAQPLQSTRGYGP